MPLKEIDCPLEVCDHVILDNDIIIGFGQLQSSLIIPAGEGGIVKKVFKDCVHVEFRGVMLYEIYNPKETLTLFRHSMHSKRDKR